MTEKELIQNLKSLRKIKPRQEWVVLTKSQIFAEPSEKKIENWGIGKFIVPQTGSRFGGGNWKFYPAHWKWAVVEIGNYATPVALWFLL